MEQKLSAKSLNAGDTEPEWMQGFGELSRLRKETARIQARIDETFEVIEREDQT